MRQRWLCTLLAFAACYPVLLRAQFSDDRAQWELAGELFEAARLREIPHEERGALDALVLPEAVRPRVKVEGEEIPSPSRLGDLPLFQGELLRRIASGPETVRLELDGTAMTIRRTPLGEGVRGVVYEVVGEEKVVKLSRASFACLAPLARETRSTRFWQEAAEGKTFTVPKTYLSHPAGVYSIKERNHGETVSEYLLRHGILKMNPDGKTVRVARSKDEMLKDPNLFRLSIAWEEMRAIIRANPNFSLPVSPNNIHISYKDPYLTEIGEIALIDLGVNPKAGSKYLTLPSFIDYLRLCADRIKKYLGMRWTRFKAVSFDEAQRSSYLEKQTLAGERVRIYGLTESVRKDFWSWVTPFLSARGATPSSMLYFGSRVMARPRLIAAEPDLEGKLPLAEGETPFDKIRESGITKLSDLDVLVVVSGLSGEAELRRLGKELTVLVRSRFRVFPVTIHLVYAPEGSPLQEQFFRARQFQAARGRALSAHQTVADFPEGLPVEAGCAERLAGAGRA